ncbi:Clp protease N-terminal domain-containing protein [Clavibacter sp. CFBP 8614]|uniref:Clp protease N-terminal domain-containing protein n=1 Tax=unclassified Clavibacter TaxID=2626594 RepID=UPI0040438339
MTGTMLTESTYISLAAAEECARLGHAEIDGEHLLLALLAVGGPSARRLHAAGVGIDEARQRVAEESASLLAEIGVTSPPIERGPSAVHPANLVPPRWSARALRLMRSIPSRAPDTALLEALRDDTVGTAARVMRDWDLDGGDQESAPRTAPRLPAGTVVHEQIAPCSSDAVWDALTSDGIVGVLFPEGAREMSRDAGGPQGARRAVAFEEQAEGRGPRHTEFAVFDGDPVVLRIEKMVPLTFAGRLVPGVVRRAIEADLRRRALALVQSVGRGAA